MAIRCIWRLNGIERYLDFKNHPFDTDFLCQIVASLDDKVREDDSHDDNVAVQAHPMTRF